VRQTDSVVTQTDSVIRQTDNVVRQTDSVVTQTDSVIRQTDSVVRQTDSVRPIPCRRPIPDTIGRADTDIGRADTDTDTDTDTGLYDFLYWKCDFARGIGVYRLYMYAGYMHENTV